MDRNQRVNALIHLQRTLEKAKENLQLETQLFAKDYAEHPIGSTIAAKTSSSGRPCKAIVVSHFVVVRDDGVQISHECLKLNKDESVSNISAYVHQSIVL